jgi:hypothetical protein
MSYSPIRSGSRADGRRYSPADAAQAIVAGIIAGDEAIFPDRVSQDTGFPAAA